MVTVSAVLYVPIFFFCSNVLKSYQTSNIFVRLFFLLQLYSLKISMDTIVLGNNGFACYLFLFKPLLFSDLSNLRSSFANDVRYSVTGSASQRFHMPWYRFAKFELD